MEIGEVPINRLLQISKILIYLCPSHSDSFGKRAHGSVGKLSFPAMNGWATELYIIELLISVAQCFSPK